MDMDLAPDQVWQSDSLSVADNWIDEDDGHAHYT